MTESPKNTRRRLGLLCLVGAIGLLIAGETVLQNWLKQIGLMGMTAYWLTCFGLTLVAALTAIRDAVRVRRETRAAQRELLEQTLQEVERERARRAESRDET
jgi:hypothetical protein